VHRDPVLPIATAPPSKNRNSSPLTEGRKEVIGHHKNPVRDNISSWSSRRKTLKTPTTGTQGIKT
jgi:hypothetical protein